MKRHGFFWVWIGLLLITPSAWAEPPLWTSLEGLNYRAEPVSFNWEGKFLLLNVPDQDEPARVYADQLDSPSRLRLLTTPEYWEAFSENRDKLESPSNAGQLVNLTRIFSLVMLCAVIMVSWSLAAWLLQSGQPLKWLTCVLLTAVSGVIIVGGANLGWPYVAEDLQPHVWKVALGVLVVVWTGVCRSTYGAPIFNCAVWPFANLAAAIFLPVTLAAAGLAAQVFTHQGTVNAESIDAYLTQYILGPTGML